MTWADRLKFFKYWTLPKRAGLRMNGRVLFRAITPPVRPQRDYRPKINRPVRAMP
jgi:hypothetical protein